MATEQSPLSDLEWQVLDDLRRRVPLAEMVASPTRKDTTGHAPADLFIDASLPGHLVSAANDNTVAITKSVRDLHQVAEGLSDGDLAEI